MAVPPARPCPLLQGWRGRCCGTCPPPWAALPSSGLQAGLGRAAANTPSAPACPWFCFWLRLNLGTDGARENVKHASPQRHCSPCWRCGSRAADLLSQALLPIALSTSRLAPSSFWKARGSFIPLRAPSSRSWQEAQMPLASGCGSQAEPGGCRLPVRFRRWKAVGEGSGCAVRFVCRGRSK